MKLIYTGSFEHLEKLGFELDGLIRYKKECLYIGVLNRMIFIPLDYFGDSLGVLYDLIQDGLVKKEEEYE